MRRRRRQREITAIRAVDRMGGRDFIVRLILDNDCKSRPKDDDYYIPWAYNCDPHYLEWMTCENLIYAFRSKFGDVSRNEDLFDDVDSGMEDYNEVKRDKFAYREDRLQKEIKAYDAIMAKTGRGEVVQTLYEKFGKQIGTGDYAAAKYVELQDMLTSDKDYYPTPPVAVLRPTLGEDF